jgi:hypothetical protein
MTRLQHFTKGLIWLVVSAEKFELLNRKDYRSWCLSPRMK